MQKYIVSSVITFFAAFFGTVGTSILAMGDVQWTHATLFSLLLVAVRAAFKAVTESYLARVSPQN